MSRTNCIRVVGKFFKFTMMNFAYMFQQWALKLFDVSIFSGTI